MYPRNAALPPRIAIGAVVQISDGAVQASGCAVRVIEEGGAEGDGAGTTAYSTDGVVLYTPTQAETDQSAFVLIAKKTGCIPVALSIVTSASATSGKVVLSGETHTSAVIPTVSVLTGHTPQTGDSFARIGITGAGLTAIGDSRLSNLDATVSSRSVYAGGAVASVTGEVGSVSGIIASDVGAIKAKTDNLPAAPASTTNITAATGITLAAATHTGAVIPTVTTVTNAPTDMATNTLLTTVAGYLDTEIAAILADTNELQTNQGNWLTATGFATPTNITAGTITTVTYLTNAPTNGDLTATMKTSLNSATPTVTVSDKTGFSLTVTPPTAVENADALLNRDMSVGTDSGSPTVRTVRQALRFLRNKWSISGSTLTVTKENDADPSWTSTVATDAGAVPVVGNDPA